MRRPLVIGRRARIVRHGVLVHGDVGAAECRVRILAGDVAADEAQQEQVIVRAVRHDLEAAAR